MTIEFVVSVNASPGTANQSRNDLVTGQVVRIALTTTGTVKAATVLYAFPSAITLTPDSASDPTYWEFTPSFTDGAVYRIQLTVDQQTRVIVLRGACANGLFLLAPGERADASANATNASQSSIIAASEDNASNNPYGPGPRLNTALQAVVVTTDSRIAGTGVSATATTTDATVTTLTSYTPATNSRGVVAELVVQARGVTSEQTNTWSLLVTGYRSSGGTVTCRDVLIVASYIEDSAWLVDADVSSGVLRIRVTGDGSESVSWRATGRVMES